jgi:hypothetical protein
LACSRHILLLVLPQPPVDKLVPFSQWITPENASVRFHTRFYVLFVEQLELELEPGADGVVKQVLLTLADHGALPPPPTPPTSRHHHRDVLIENPTPDGGLEITSASWFHLFAAFRRGQLALFPPPYYLLTTLMDFLDSKYQGSNKAEVLRSRIGAFGARLFNP